MAPGFSWSCQTLSFYTCAPVALIHMPLISPIVQCIYIYMLSYFLLFQLFSRSFSILVFLSPPSSHLRIVLLLWMDLKLTIESLLIDLKVYPPDLVLHPYSMSDSQLFKINAVAPISSYSFHAFFFLVKSRRLRYPRCYSATNGLQVRSEIWVH